jgi:ornithine cyclodeaminase/alanine dehydrogenase-like protein (mu-crystallin family)
MTALFTRAEIAAAVPISDCIDAVERAFVAHGEGRAIPPGVLGSHVDGGGFHVKTAGLHGKRAYYAAKINANFPRNRETTRLPTIQGALILFDAMSGQPLAIMDSAEVTKLRTAAASAVAARHLARSDASTLAICGCGVQGRVHLDALRAVRRVRRVFAYDGNRQFAEAFARELTTAECDVIVSDSVSAACAEADIVATCTSATSPILHFRDLRPGTFVAAVGTDSEHKHEIAPDVLAKSRVVADILDQCVQIGDLHHAIAARAMTRDDVHAELADVVTGRKRGRSDDAQIFVFDSTGTALEDVAAAALVYERATPRQTIDFTS